MKHFLLAVAIIIFITSCADEAFDLKKVAVIKENQKATSALMQAFIDAKEKNNLSSWPAAKGNLLPLTIIGPVYDTQSDKKRKSYKKLKALIEHIYESPKVLDLISGKHLQKNYTSVDYIPYKINSEEHDVYNAVYSKRNAPVETLNDILRDYDGSAVDQDGMAIAVKINFNELEKGYLVLEGYKTIKEPGKDRNSYYFSLRRKADDITDRLIQESFIAAMQLSIPKYHSIDRSNVLAKGVKLQVINQFSETNYATQSWTYEAAEAKDRLKSTIYSERSKFAPQFVFQNSLGKTDIKHIAISNNGTYVVAKENKVLVYNKTHRLLQTITNPVNVSAIAINDTASLIAVGGKDATIKVYSSSGYTKQTFIGHTKEISTLRFIPKTTYIFSGSLASNTHKGMLKIWNYNNARTIRDLDYHAGSITAMAVSSDGSRAVTAALDNKIIYWNLSSQSRIFTISNAHKSRVTAIDIDMQGDKIISTGWDKDVNVWSASSGRLLKRVTHLKDLGIHAQFIGGNFAVVLEGNGHAMMWDMRNYNMVKDLKLEAQSVFDTMHANGDIGVVASKDKLHYLDMTMVNDVAKIKKLKNTIDVIKAADEWTLNSTTQRVFTSPLLKRDLEILQKYHLITLPKEYDSLPKKKLDEIATVIGCQFLDPVVTPLFYKVYQEYADLDISLHKQAFLIVQKELYDLEDVYFTTEFNLKKQGYKEIDNRVNIKSLSAIQ